MARYLLTQADTELTSQLESFLLYFPFTIDTHRRVEMHMPLAAVWYDSMLNQFTDTVPEIAEAEFKPIKFNSGDNLLEFEVKEMRGFNSQAWEHPKGYSSIHLFEGHVDKKDTSDNDVTPANWLTVTELNQHIAQQWQEDDRPPCQQLSVRGKPAYVVWDRNNSAKNLSLCWINGLETDNNWSHIFSNAVFKIKDVVDQQQVLSPIEFSRNVLQAGSQKVNREANKLERFTGGYASPTMANGFVVIADGIFKNLQIENSMLSKWNALHWKQGEIDDKYQSVKNQFRELVNGLIIQSKSSNSVSTYEQYYKMTKLAHQEVSSSDWNGILNQMPPAEMVFISGVGIEDKKLARFCGS